jgi:hypothetical protein
LKEEGKQDIIKMIIYEMVYLPTLMYGPQSSRELTRRVRIKNSKI